MIYSILFYTLLTMLFIVGTFTMTVLKRGGTVSVYPIDGVGLIYQRTRVWVPTQEEQGFWLKGVTIGIIFVFIVFQWDDVDGDIDPMDMDNDSDLNTQLHGG